MFVTIKQIWQQFMELGISLLYPNEVMEWTDLEKHTDMTTDN